MSGNKAGTFIISRVFEYAGLENLYRVFWQYSQLNCFNPDRTLLWMYNEDANFKNWKKEVLDTKKYKNIYDTEVQVLKEYFKSQSDDWIVELVASEYCLCSIYHPSYGPKCIKNFWFVRLLVLEEK